MLEEGSRSFLTQRDLAELQSNVLDLHSRVSVELIGARFLWTNGILNGEERLIPWDVESTNAAPNTFIWKKHSPHITVKLPGLYRLTIAVFTIEENVTLQCFLNDEPLLTYKPSSTRASTSLQSNRGKGHRRRCPLSLLSVVITAQHLFGLFQ